MTPAMRFVRICVEHRRALAASIITAAHPHHTRETLVCPVGDHETERWLVVDAARGTVLAGATFERIFLLAPFDPPGDFRPRQEHP